MSIFRVIPSKNEGAIKNPDFRNDLVLNQHTTGINNPQENPDFITSIKLSETSFEQNSVTFNDGWNMFTFTGTQPLPIRDFFRLIFPNHNTNTDDDFDTYVQGIIVQGVRDLSRAYLYFPDFNHSQIDSNGGLIPGIGYQAKFNFNPTGEGINKKNGLPILPNGVGNPSFPDLASLEGISNITDYINAHANVSFNNTYNDGIQFMDLSDEGSFGTGTFTGFGFSRLQKKDARQVLYKLFFPQGAPGHVLDSNGLPISGIFLENIHSNQIPQGIGQPALGTPIGAGNGPFTEIFTNNGFIISTGLSDSIIEGSDPPRLNSNTTMAFLIDDILASIVDLVKDNDGNFFSPSFRFNNLENLSGNGGYLIPGRGYQIRFTGQGTNPTPFNLPPDDIPNINPLIDGGIE
jgi:hypothetical protein